jgi:hypothetical protein
MEGDEGSLYDLMLTEFFVCQADIAPNCGWKSPAWHELA